MRGEVSLLLVSVRLVPDVSEFAGAVTPVPDTKFEALVPEAFVPVPFVPFEESPVPNVLSAADA